MKGSEWVGGEVALPGENKAKVQDASTADTLLTRLTRAEDTEGVAERALEIQGNSNAHEGLVVFYPIFKEWPS